jgi:hypothetical protein
MTTSSNRPAVKSSTTSAAGLLTTAAIFGLLLHGGAFRLSAGEWIAIRGAMVETVSPAGAIPDGVVLIHDGKIEAVGSEVKIPDEARIIEAHGGTLIPGIVDPYYVVPVDRGGEPAPQQPLVPFGRGRGFRGGGFQRPSTSLPFIRVNDGFDPASETWRMAVRSGITTPHLVSTGFGQSAIGRTSPDDPLSAILNPDGNLFMAVANDSASLGQLRTGLSGRGGPGGGPPGVPAGGGGGEGDQPPGGRRPGGGFSRGGGRGGPSDDRQTAPLWEACRKGERPLFVNASNAATILHVTEALKSSPQARIALVAPGAEVFQAIDVLPKTGVTVVLSPRIDVQANSQVRINPAQILHEKGMPFCLSLSSSRTDFAATQSAPLFPLAILNKAGLSRQAALEAVTRVPAALLGIGDRVGSIEPGKQADLVLFDSDPFEATAGIRQVFVEGRKIYEDQDH